MALDATRIRVGGNVEFRGGTLAKGEVNLMAAQIEGRLTLAAVTLDNPVRSALFARDIRVKSDFRLVQVVAHGDIKLERAEVTGELLWDRLEVSLPTAPVPARKPGQAKINLEHVRIGGLLQARSLFVPGNAVVDLSGARIGTIRSYWPSGWGRDAISSNGTAGLTVILTGLEYEDIDARCDEGIKVSFLGHLVGLLDLQWGGTRANETSFSSQPYRQMARVLRAQGEDETARRIAINEQDQRHRRRMAEQRAQANERSIAGQSWFSKWRFAVQGWFWAIFHRGYGVFFGYGNRPLAALLTVALYVLIGAFGVFFAQRGGLLIERPLPVAMYAVKPTHAGAGAAFDRVVPEYYDPKDTVSDLACVDAAQNFWDDIVYAVDVILPFIELREETKCEIQPGEEGLSPYIRASRDFYAIFGWIISSLTLLAASRFLRRTGETASE